MRALATIDGTTVRGKRDRALLLLGWSGAFRRGEIVAIDVEHIRWEPEGIEIELVRSKTNQSGEAEYVLIPYALDESVCPVRSLRSAASEWLGAPRLQWRDVVAAQAKKTGAGALRDLRYAILNAQASDVTCSTRILMCMPPTFEWHF